MKLSGLAILALALVTVGAPAALADSLYNPDGPNGNLMSFTRPNLGVGNLVTVVVTENNTAEAGATTNRSKDSKVGADWDFGTLLPKVVKSSIGLHGTDDFKGTGITSRNGKLQMDVGATIEEVLPNGTLRIIGHKQIRVNEEDTEITIRGVIRPLDISVDNRVDSSRVANMQVDYKGNGPIAAKNTPGVLTRLLNWLF